MSPPNLRLLIYAATPSTTMLNQGFYAAEATGLRREDSVGSVRLTNRLKDVATDDYDGLVAYFYSFAALAALIARLRGKPCVATGGAEQIFRSMAPSWPVYAVRMLLFQLTVFFADRVLATSTTDFERMRSVAWTGQRKIELSFHGVAATEVQNVDQIERVRPTASMLTICGMDTDENVRRKGLYHAVDLLARLHEADASARLTIIGRDTRRDLVEAHARCRGVADRITYAGYVSEDKKLEMLRTHRFYIQLSDYEGFGIGALEALAQGCQVIHTNVGGLKDTIGSYGVSLRPDQIPDVSIPAFDHYLAPEQAVLSEHLAQFSVAGRAKRILAGLGLGETLA